MKWIFIFSILAAGCRPEPDRFTVVPLAPTSEQHYGPRALVVDQHSAVAWILVDSGPGAYDLERHRLDSSEPTNQITAGMTKAQALQAMHRPVTINDHLGEILIETPWTNPHPYYVRLRDGKVQSAGHLK